MGVNTDMMKFQLIIIPIDFLSPSCFLNSVWPDHIRYLSHVMNHVLKQKLSSNTHLYFLQSARYILSNITVIVLENVVKKYVHSTRDVKICACDTRQPRCIHTWTAVLSVPGAASVDDSYVAMISFNSCELSPRSDRARSVSCFWKLVLKSPKADSISCQTSQQ